MMSGCTSTIAARDDGYIVQCATKIVTAFNEHLAAKCEHCECMMREIYKNHKAVGLHNKANSNQTGQAVIQSEAPTGYADNR